MGLDRSVKRHLPGVWFCFKFLKYKYLGRGEPEFRLIRHLVPAGTVAIDAGSSIGMYSAELARHARRVLAFEANPEVAAFARSVAARNVEVINVALSSASGRATLKTPLNAKGHPVTELASIDPATPLNADASVATEIETRRLDSFDAAPCGFIKIDVEGHEEAVLDGAWPLIEAQRPALLIELNEFFRPGVLGRVDARLSRLSYRGCFLSQGRLLPVSSYDPALHHDVGLLKYPRHKLPAGREFINNFIFIPEERYGLVMERMQANA